MVSITGLAGLRRELLGLCDIAARILSNSLANGVCIDSPSRVLKAENLKPRLYDSPASANIVECDTENTYLPAWRVGPATVYPNFLAPRVKWKYLCGSRVATRRVPLFYPGPRLTVRQKRIIRVLLYLHIIIKKNSGIIFLLFILFPSLSLLSFCLSICLFLF
jgi:hypothetical protein